MTEESHLITSYRHVYDVDAFEILDRMKDKYKSNNNIISVKSLKFEEDNLVKFLIEEGIVPFKLFILKSNATTLLSLIVTPFQVDTSKDKSQVVFQLSPFVELYKSTNAFFSKLEI